MLFVENAVKPYRDGVVISLFVTPNSRDSEFPTGYNPWRNCLEMRIRAPASENKANKEIMRLLASFFNVSDCDVYILSGEKNRVKKLFISSISYPDVIRKLKEFF